MRMRVEMTFLAVAAICFLVMPHGNAGVGTVSSEQLREEFKAPPKVYRPMVRWWWPGGDVEETELRREVGILDDAHFGGAEIQPSSIGLKLKLPEDVQKRVNNYLTSEFYANLRAALEEAESRSMWLDLTFGSGWPFGGGENITPDLASMELRYAHTSIRGPVHYDGKLPMPERPPGFGTLLRMATAQPLSLEWEQWLKKREELVAVVAFQGDEAVLEEDVGTSILGVPRVNVKKTGMLNAASVVVLTDKVSDDGTLQWEVPEGLWQVFVFVQFPADLWVIGGLGGGPQLVLDHLKRAAMESHIEAVSTGLEKNLKGFFGNGLRAVFCDSLEVLAYLYWTDDFLEEFRQRRGYDLTPFLPVLKVPGFGNPYADAYESLPIYDIEAVGERIRHDYWHTVSDVFIDEFCKPFVEWAEGNGLLARMQAHGAPGDILRMYGLSHIPEAENLYDGGRYDFLKMASSAAYVYGRDIASSESFVWRNKDYQTTPEIIKRYTDELITAGLNQIIYHGFPYEYMDRPEPGWFPFAAPFPFSSHMNHHNPFWEFLRPINDYITRLQYLSRVGETVTPIALYRGDQPYPGPKAAPELEINQPLMSAGYNFDHINAHALLASKAEDGELVSPGGARYGLLIFWEEASISVDLAEKLVRFAENGLPMLFVASVPDEAPGYHDYETKSARVRSLMKKVVGSMDGATNERGSGRLVSTPEEMMAALRQTLKPNLRFSTPQDSVFFIEKAMGPLRAYIMRNGSPEQRQFYVEFPVTGGSPEIWDPWTGEISPVLHFETVDSGVRLGVDLAPYGSSVFVFDPKVNHAPQPSKARAPVPLPAPITLGGEGNEWRLRAEAPERQGNLESYDLQLTELVDWSRHEQLHHFSGKGTYTISFDLAREYVQENARLEIDLGMVKDVAEVRVNGKDAGTLLFRPYRADITALVRPGENALEVTVTNTLLNYLIGAGIKQASPFDPNRVKPELLPSGLLGPVRVIPTR